MASARVHLLILSSLWSTIFSFDLPDSCHGTGTEVNGTECCALLQEQCDMVVNETVFNCTHGDQDLLPYRSNLFHLTMSKCGLNGEIPVNITLLNYLRTLDLSGNFLIGKIPSDIGEIGANGLGMESIDLSDNNLEGIIPVSIGQEELQTHLKYLDLSLNYLTRMSMPALTTLTALEHLDLSHNQIAETYHETLHSFVNLKVLNLGTNRISGDIPSTIGALTQLEVLVMERNDMTGELPADLSQLANLKTLNVSDNKFEGSIPSQWAEHWTDGQLDHLNLGHNLFDCPVTDYSRWAGDSDFEESYGSNGRSNCNDASTTTDSDGLNGVEVTMS